MHSLEDLITNLLKIGALILLAGGTFVFLILLYPVILVRRRAREVAPMITRRMPNSHEGYDAEARIHVPRNPTRALLLDPIPVRLPFLPAWFAATMGLIITVPVGAIVGFICIGFAIWILGTSGGILSKVAEIALGTFAGALTGIIVILCWRLVYGRFRWRDVDYDGSYCLNCKYDLTGCVSGICPECGAVDPCSFADIESNASTSDTDE